MAQCCGSLPKSGTLLSAGLSPSGRRAADTVVAFDLSDEFGEFVGEDGDSFEPCSQCWVGLCRGVSVIPVNGDPEPGRGAGISDHCLPSGCGSRSCRSEKDGTPALEGYDCHVAVQVKPRSAGTPMARELPSGRAVYRSIGHVAGTPHRPRVIAGL